jgi:hypothetical protein
VVQYQTRKVEGANSEQVLEGSQAMHETIKTSQLE